MNQANPLPLSNSIKKYGAELWDYINANKGDYHFDINIEVTAGGHYQGIIDYAKKSKSNLIIIGNRGSSKYKRRSFRSVAENLITHPQIPVLAIPEDFSIIHIKRILFAADLVSPLSAFHYTFLKDFAEKLQAEIHVINVRERFHPAFEEEEVALVSLENNLGENRL